MSKFEKFKGSWEFGMNLNHSVVASSDAWKMFIDKIMNLEDPCADCSMVCDSNCAYFVD